MNRRSLNFSLCSVVDVYDAATECVVASAPLDTAKTEQAAANLHIDIQQLAAGATFDLDREQLMHLRSACAVPLPNDASLGRLRRRVDTDDLPYKVHTNRELLLMLTGRKPLAVFTVPFPSVSGAEDLPEHLFDPYVNSGRFVKRETIEPLSLGGERQIRRVLYAFPTEVWRIDAYLLLMRTARICGWNEALERMEGSLLGYEDWQNDAYIDLLKRRQQE